MRITVLAYIHTHGHTHTRTHAHAHAHTHSLTQTHSGAAMLAVITNTLRPTSKLSRGFTSFCNTYLALISSAPNLMLCSSICVTPWDPCTFAENVRKERKKETKHDNLVRVKGLLSEVCSVCVFVCVPVVCNRWCQISAVRFSVSFKLAGQLCCLP
jgi:hypothetical protein